jgi:hypothetical protein
MLNSLANYVLAFIIITNRTHLIPGNSKICPANNLGLWLHTEKLVLPIAAMVHRPSHAVKTNASFTLAILSLKTDTHFFPIVLPFLSTRVESGAVVNARTRYAGDDREYRDRARSLLVGPLLGQADRAGPWPGLHVRYAVSTDLFDAIGLADRRRGAAGDDRAAQRTYPRLQVQVRLGAISRSI